MPFGPSDMCPGGTGKRIRNCMCRDIQRDLERVGSAVDGGQNVAALAQVERLLAQHPDRPCLWSTKAMLQVRTDDAEGHAATAREFMARAPDNAAALAHIALAEATVGKLEAATERIQDLLEMQRDDLPVDIAPVLFTMAVRLANNGRAVAAIRHCDLAADCSQAFREDAMALYESLAEEGRIPAALFGALELTPPPPNAPWIGEWDAECAPSRHGGTWRKACRTAEALASRFPTDPALIRNVALLHMWLGRQAEAVEWLRKFARLPNISWEDASEAEAMATSLDDDSSWTVTVRREYAIDDVDATMASLLSDRHCQAVDIESIPRDLEDGPPPKGAFRIFDRPRSDPTGEATADDLMITAGQLILFGKETDRPARLNVIVREYPGSEFDPLEHLRAVAGVAWDEPVSETRLPMGMQRPWPEWHLSSQSTTARRQTLYAERTIRFVRQDWPKRPNPALDGLTPAAAACETSLRLRTLGVLLLLEAELQRVGFAFSVNELRRQLSLPTLDAITEVTDPVRLPMVRWSRLDPTRLSDDQLESMALQVTVHRVAMLMRSFFLEVVRRRTDHGRLTATRALDILIGFIPADNAVSEAMDALRAAAAARGEPAWPWALRELHLLLARGDLAEFGPLVKSYLEQFRNDREAIAAVQSFMLRVGLVSADGRLVIPVMRPAAEASPATPAAHIWTPEQSTAPGQPAAKKLWLPGMD